jgi:hypothetical protein
MTPAVRDSIGRAHGEGRLSMASRIAGADLSGWRASDSQAHPEPCGRTYEVLDAKRLQVGLHDDRREEIAWVRRGVVGVVIPLEVLALGHPHRFDGCAARVRRASQRAPGTEEESLTNGGLRAFDTRPRVLQARGGDVSRISIGASLCGVRGSAARDAPYDTAAEISELAGSATATWWTWPTDIRLSSHTARPMFESGCWM